MTDRLAEIERRLRQLEDERAIARLIASYGPLVDAGDADGAAALRTAEGIYDTGDWLMTGRSELASVGYSPGPNHFCLRRSNSPSS